MKAVADPAEAGKFKLAVTTRVATVRAEEKATRNRGRMKASFQ
jgi:hypothetical protein